MKKHLLILILLFFISVDVFCQNDEKNWTLQGYLKYMSITSFEDVNDEWIGDNMFHNRLNFKWYINYNWTFAAEMRNRFVYGESVKNPLFDYADFMDDEKGFFDLSHVWLDETSFIFHSVIDRLWLDFTKGKWQIRAGRQRINWSQAMVWNPNDLFNTYSFFDFDYEEKPGSDALRIQYYPGVSSKLEIAAKYDHLEKITAAALYRFNKWSYDIQFLGGMLNETDYVLGSGWSGEILKGGFYGEISYFHPRKEFEKADGSISASGGYNYTFKNSLMLQFESLYNSNGYGKSKFDLSQFYYKEMSAKDLSLSQWSFFGQASYPFTPLINGSFGAMYSPNDESFYLGPTCTVSLTDNLQFMGTLQHFESSNPSALGGKGTYVFLRLKGSF